MSRKQPIDKASRTYETSRTGLWVVETTLSTTLGISRMIPGSSQRFAAMRVAEPLGPYFGNNV
jgi:hypothetical protein